MYSRYNALLGKLDDLIVIRTRLLCQMMLMIPDSNLRVIICYLSQKDIRRKKIDKKNQFLNQIKYVALSKTMSYVFPSDTTICTSKNVSSLLFSHKTDLYILI